MFCTRARIFALTMLAVLAGATLTHAQAQFQYPNFGSAAGLQLNGDAATFSNDGPFVLRLTPGSGNQDGSAWYTTQIPLASGFTSTFTFQFTGQGGSGGHADGIAFVIQGAPTGVNSEGSEGTFTICTFWLVDNLAMQGRIDEAKSLFERLLSSTGRLGLFSEEIDSRSKIALGNYPQAFTHIALINSAINLQKAEWRLAKQHTDPVIAAIKLHHDHK